ncbi:MAG TPA: type 4a pilus biogenesis protein PilO [Longimicrobiales bacterium]|nr:type 4a pilus biogenesis protein PilO [Longimicrobiales bacterium]
MGLLPSDPNQQKKLLIGLVPLLLLLAYWYLFHGAKAEEVAAMETRLEALEQNNNTARTIASQGSTEELARRLELYEEHMQRLEQLIPMGEEVPDLLNMIASRAEISGVQLSLMRPEEDVATEFYRRVTYQMGVIGDYHDIGAFLAEVGSLPRIVTPIDLTLRRRAQDRRALEASFRIETYILPQPGDTTGVTGA